MYDPYPGSIVDVSTLKNTIKKINSQGICNYALIMDQFSFSTSNIEEMVSGDLSFKSVKEAMAAIHSNIDDPQYLKLYQKEPLFVMPIMIRNASIRNEIRSISGCMIWSNASKM